VEPELFVASWDSDVYKERKERKRKGGRVNCMCFEQEFSGWSSASLKGTSEL
jgi:hypothetical protein